MSVLEACYKKRFLFEDAVEKLNVTVIEVRTLNFFFTPDLSPRIMVWRGRLSVWRLSVGLSAKLVNMIETEPFQLGPSNLVHILLMTRR